jgi:chromosomal replication initiation ATPase DnaA
MTPAARTRGIIAEVAERHGVTVEALIGERRFVGLVVARHEAMYEIAKQNHGFSYPSIGKVFGGRDHTSVLHGVRRHCKRIGVDYELFSSNRVNRVSWLSAPAFKAYGRSMRGEPVGWAYDHRRVAA